MKKLIRAHLRRCAGFARVLTVLLVVFSLLLLCSARAALARSDDAMMDLGRHLMALAESGVADQRGVVINGQRLGFRVFSTEQGLETALDFYQAWCHGDGGPFAEQEAALALLDESWVGEPQTSHSWKDLVMRSSDDEMGFVACLKHGVANASSEELALRLRTFFASGNLHDLGQFHYAAVSKVGATVRVVVVWTDGDFFPLRMFPASGDAPGFDPIGLPRPPSGRRVLSAGELGNEGTITVYVDCEEELSELAAFYGGAFVRQGWRLLSQDEIDGGYTFVIQRDGEMRLLTLGDEQESRSISIVATR